ncbi:MAG: ATP synthase F1 subunit epsilon [Alphaproteobacteria bacterium]
MSEAQKIQFELVSPEEKLVSEPVSMAVVPGVEGEMGVMAGHSSFVVALKPGVVQLYVEEGKQPGRKIFIAGGFADITAENCTVLAESAVNVKDLDRATIEQDLTNLSEDLGLAAEEADKARIQGKIDLAQARLEAVTKG